MNQSPLKKILIVDDERDIREALCQALELNGYEVAVVSSGEEALKVLCGPEKPSLILLDLMMPNMDGFEFMKIRNLSSGINGIPVVIISASRGLELGEFNVQGYLKKPISLSSLLQTAERYCC